MNRAVLEKADASDDTSATVDLVGLIAYGVTEAALLPAQSCPFIPNCSMDLMRESGKRPIDRAVLKVVIGVTTRKCSECTTSGTLSELRPPVEIAAAAAL